MAPQRSTAETGDSRGDSCEFSIQSQIHPKIHSLLPNLTHEIDSPSSSILPTPIPYWSSHPSRNYEALPGSLISKGCSKCPSSWFPNIVLPQHGPSGAASNSTPRPLPDCQRLMFRRVLDSSLQFGKYHVPIDQSAVVASEEMQRKSHADAVRLGKNLGTSPTQSKGARLPASRQRTSVSFASKPEFTFFWKDSPPWILGPQHKPAQPTKFWRSSRPRPTLKQARGLRHPCKTLSTVITANYPNGHITDFGSPLRRRDARLLR